MSNPNPQFANNLSNTRIRRTRRSPVRGWLRMTAVMVFMFFMLSFVAHTMSQRVEAAGPPVVNGLFYGDGDNNDYFLYSTSEYGSGLYLYFDNPTLYVALVVDRSVNDNVFGNRPYTQSSGMNPPRAATQLVNSEFAGFTLSCENAPREWDWGQGYAGLVGGTWISDETVAGGFGTPPPGYVSASSFAWNINTYESKAYPSGVPWDMYVLGTDIAKWKSPWDASDPDNVIGLDGYPATGSLGFSTVYDYEWSMIYEWSADLTVCGSNPIFVVSGLSHHSPSKNGDQNDDFPPQTPQPLADYGDLPDSYSTYESSNGPRHILTINGAYLGTSPDSEADGQPSSDASGDITSKNDEDGVTVVDSTNWAPGNTVQLNLDVQGTTPTADVGIWIDWNGDGNFDEANEFYSFMNLPTGGISTVDIQIPGNYNAGDSLYARARIFNDEADAPGDSLDAGDYEGMGSTGEVEDYQWFFGPTAITLINATTGNQDTGLMLVLALTVVVLIVTVFYLRRRQMLA